MTNVLKMAIEKDEEKLACIITAYYEVELNEDMIIKALTSENFEWLFFVWAFDKNYIGLRHKAESLFITFEQLFDLVKKNYHEDRTKVTERI